jgi:hypothetical protein
MYKVGYRTRLAFIVLFAVAMAYFEAAVVVYLRELFYPEGFTYPLKLIPQRLIVIELLREASTLLMLLAVAVISGRRFWERFGYFLLVFGIWDIFYYVWLKVTIDWPSSLLEWDILFLIPIPWIGPVIAPVLVALLMSVTGFLITRLFALGFSFKPTVFSWVSAVVGTAAILYSFMRDTAASLHWQMPQPYWYSLLILGLVLYVIAFSLSYRKATQA